MRRMRRKKRKKKRKMMTKPNCRAPIYPATLLFASSLPTLRLRMSLNTADRRPSLVSSPNDDPSTPTTSPNISFSPTSPTMILSLHDYEPASASIKASFGTSSTVKDASKRSQVLVVSAGQVMKPKPWNTFSWNAKRKNSLNNEPYARNPSPRSAPSPLPSYLDISPKASQPPKANESLMLLAPSYVLSSLSKSFSYVSITN
jgi:hypothetical protein